MKTRLALLVLVLVAFCAYTAAVVAEAGLTAFLPLALSEPWAGQMLVDLVIALVLFATWMRADAGQQGLPFWPYAALIVATGSIGALAYLVHRTAKEVRDTRPIASPRSA